jgi:hypothetical protein
MQSAEAKRYCDMMVEVKGRTHLIRTFGATHVGVLPLPALVELFYLHVRKILELIAMGSLLANAKSFGVAHEKLKKYWNPKDLLRDIEKLNPNFYPKPIIQKPSKSPGILMDWLERKDDFLTKDQFITLYDKCGSVLHTKNPFRPDPDYPSLALEIPKWCTLIVNLLNAHTIRLQNDPNLYLIQMGNKDTSPTYTVFAPQTKMSASHPPEPNPTARPPS